jgi:uncharacterized protein YgiM (DUF1202 family)
LNGKQLDSPRRVSWILAILLGAMLLAPLSPTDVRASTDLTIGGWAVIADANGDSVRMREDPGPSYPIVGSYPEGTVVEVLDGPFASDDDGSLWYHVAVNRQSGFIIADYLAPSDGNEPPVGEPPVDEPPADDPPVVTGTAVIANTGGDRIRCRTVPSTAANIIARFVEGDVVELLGDAVDGWQPVLCDGQVGYVAAEFIGSGEEPEPTPTSTPDPGDDSDAETGTGQISGTNGDGVRCRADASTDASIIVVLPEGTEVPLRGALKGEWQPVTCAGQRGFVHGLYIGPIDDDDDDDDTGGDSNSSFDVGETIVVAGTNGDGVRFRARASFDGAVIVVVREGQEVEVRAGSTGDWVAVSYRGSDGFIHLDYLAPRSASNEEPGPGGSGDVGTGDHAMVTENLRLRAEPNMDGDVLAIAAASTVVVVTGSPSDGFYPVDWDGLEGWMSADYLTWTDAPVTPRETGVGGDAGSDPGSSEGSAMVDYAMQYLGYPYVWATHGPDTFDCSGFTYWVALHVLGTDISAGTWPQSVAGRPVAYGELQPGDLVFFQNTYRAGISHVGIYIGDGLFVHAENEGTGVVITSIYSDYYASHYWGAVRVG